MAEFPPRPKSAETSLREVVKHYSKGGTISDAVRPDIELVREQNKLKSAILIAPGIGLQLVEGSFSGI